MRVITAALRNGIEQQQHLVIQARPGASSGFLVDFLVVPREQE